MAKRNDQLDGMKEQLQAQSQNHQQPAHPVAASQDYAEFGVLMSVMSCATFASNELHTENDMPWNCEFLQESRGGAICLLIIDTA